MPILVERHIQYEKPIEDHLERDIGVKVVVLKSAAKN
jgi:hypothetical protein